MRFKGARKPPFFAASPRSWASSENCHSAEAQQKGKLKGGDTGATPARHRRDTGSTPARHRRWHPGFVCSSAPTATAEATHRNSKNITESLRSSNAAAARSMYTGAGAPRSSPVRAWSSGPARASNGASGPKPTTSSKRHAITAIALLCTGPPFSGFASCGPAGETAKHLSSTSFPPPEKCSLFLSKTARAVHLRCWLIAFMPPA
jgi:hypothetical protein